MSKSTEETITSTLHLPSDPLSLSESLPTISPTQKFQSFQIGDFLVSGNVDSNKLLGDTDRFHGLITSSYETIKANYPDVNHPSAKILNDEGFLKGLKENTILYQKDGVLYFGFHANSKEEKQPLQFAIIAEAKKSLGSIFPDALEFVTITDLNRNLIDEKTGNYNPSAIEAITTLSAGNPVVKVTQAEYGVSKIRVNNVIQNQQPHKALEAKLESTMLVTTEILPAIRAEIPVTLHDWSAKTTELTYRNLAIDDTLGTDHGPAHDVIEFDGKKTVVFAINAMPTASITQEIQNYKHDPDGDVQKQLDKIHAAQLLYTETLYKILNQKLTILVNEETGAAQDFNFYSMTAEDISSFLNKFGAIVKSTTTSPKTNLEEAIKEFVASSAFKSFISMVSDAKILGPGEPDNIDPKKPTKLDYIGRKDDLTDVQISELADLVISKPKEMAVLITGILKGSRKVSLEPLEGFEPKLNGKDDPTSAYANELQITQICSYVSKTVSAADNKANSRLEFIAFVIEGGEEAHPESFLRKINDSLSSIHPDHYEEFSSVILEVLSVNGDGVDTTDYHV